MEMLRQPLSMTLNENQRAMFEQEQKNKLEHEPEQFGNRQQRRRLARMERKAKQEQV